MVHWLVVKYLWKLESATLFTDNLTVSWRAENLGTLSKTGKELNRHSWETIHVRTSQNTVLFCTCIKLLRQMCCSLVIGMMRKE